MFRGINGSRNEAKLVEEWVSHDGILNSKGLLVQKLSERVGKRVDFTES